jgi:hypothetical protein
MLGFAHRKLFSGTQDSGNVFMQKKAVGTLKGGACPDQPGGSSTPEVSD